MDPAEELGKQGLAVKIGYWTGACSFADNIILVADSEQELQRMLDEEKWKVTINQSNCRVLVIGQEKQNTQWRLDNETLDEVKEYKYLLVNMDKQNSK